MPIDELKRNIRLSIDYTEKDLLPSVTTRIQKYVKNLKSEQHLLSLDFLLVSELIKTYYSTTHYSTHATRLLSLTPNKLTLQYLEALTPRIDICGIDIDTPFNPLDHAVYDEEREKHMANKLVEYKDSGSSIILRVGKIHLFGLYRLLAAANLLDQTIFFDLSSKETLDPGFT